MAEAVAAFYAVETAAEGAAVGALAIRQPTVPLHVRFHKIKSPDDSLQRSSHSLTVVKNRAYIFGGDVSLGKADNDVRVLTLPTDLALDDIDYQLIRSRPAPERPLASYGGDYPTGEEAVARRIREANVVPEARAAHAATSIDSDIFVLGGRKPRAEGDSTSDLVEAGTVFSFSTDTNTWTTLTPHETRCNHGVPEPRTYASLTSTPHPLPGSSTEVSTSAHGTLFLHGGYDAQGELLRDVWTFDVSSRVWTRWPEIPEPGPEDIASEGSICSVESRLWRVGDGFGKMMYLETVRDDADDGSGRSELGVSPKTGEWKTLSFKTTAGGEKQPTAKADHLPTPRQGAGFIPITTGAGRHYLLYLMGEEAPDALVRDIWTFQIASSKTSLAMVKDKVINTIGKSSGENEWSRCEVVEATKQDGVIPAPQGLSRFACDAWTDMGGGYAVLWGGKNAKGDVMNEGWILAAE